MNYLKKKLKPLGLNYGSAAATTATSAKNRTSANNRDLEDDLYDEYVVEAPPHPSELLALGVEPSEIDVNDPQKLRDLYRKAKQEGKCANSILLARERQKEEIEAKKKTREEWKFFENLSARVEQAVKDSQKTLEQLKESSAIDELTQPDYELVLSADQVFKSSAGVKREKSITSWIKFSDDGAATETPGQSCKEEAELQKLVPASQVEADTEAESSASRAQNFVVEELLNDLGLDLRSEEQKRAAEAELARKTPVSPPPPVNPELTTSQQPAPTPEVKLVARPRPRPNSTASHPNQIVSQPEVDPFDTSFVEPHTDCLPQLSNSTKIETQTATPATTLNTTSADPFDTSFVSF